MKTTTTFYRSIFMFALCVSFAYVSQAQQIAFTNFNSLITTATHSGCCVSVVDVNSDGLDDILIMDQSKTLVLEQQNRDGSFTRTSLGTIPDNAKVWGMAVADVDHNGWKDVATGSGSCYLYKLSYSGGNVTATITQLSASYFVQNITFGDFNNDGWADLHVCDDDDYSKVYQNDGTGNLVLTTSLINTNINPGLTYGSDPYDSGNYGSVWTDFDNDGDLDLYIAHCRQSTSSNTDQRRRDRLFVNNGNNVFTENAQSYGIEVSDFKQTWTTSFGDIDNDGDLDIVMTNHGENGQILENDGTGHFTDITSASGLTTPGMDPIESMVEDFDNDGFLDIFITGGGNGDSYFLYHNNGNKTFTLVTLPIPSTTNGMLSFATGDLNHDGKIDMYASYGNVYNTPTSTADVLYLNTTHNSNHFITFDLKGTVSNLGAIGARVTIYGPWGKQIREVRAGESYGTCNSFQCHFGLGQNTMVDSARIDWPSHLQTHLTNLAADQFVTSVENGCNISGNVIPGPYVLCTGQTVTLSTGSGFSAYSWSTGSTASSILVSTAGVYNVMVTQGSCTNLSPSVTVELNPDQTPTVTSTATSNSCAGTATLTSSPALAYTWSGPNGFTATTQSINPIESGNYSVTIQGSCANFSSAPTSVTLLAAPAPTASDVSGNGPASFLLTAVGNGGLLSWYDLPVGGTLLGTGSTYNTPVINASATYYVQEATTYPGSSVHTGQANHSGTSLYNNTINGGLDFNVIAPCTLVSVKVITESTHYGTREFQIKNSGGTVIASQIVNIQSDTTVVALNFPLSVGSSYRLTTNGTLNTTNFGAVSPYFQRSSSGVSYPFTISNVLSITNGFSTTTTNTAYYYFYDWVVATPPIICESPMVPVQVTVTPSGINNFTADNHLHIYPNPTSAHVTVSFNLPGATSSKVEFIDAVGRVVSSEVFENIGGNYSHVFDLSNFSKGIYTIHVSSQDKTSYQRLIIQ